MDAAVLYEIGKTPRFDQFPEPVAAEGEVVVHVHAASLKPVDKQLASGSHFASPRELRLRRRWASQRRATSVLRRNSSALRRDGERTAVPRAFTFAVPDGVDDETAASLPNPGVSAWLSLASRAKLRPGETSLFSVRPGLPANWR